MQENHRKPIYCESLCHLFLLNIEVVEKNAETTIENSIDVFQIVVPSWTVLVDFRPSWKSAIGHVVELRLSVCLRGEKYHFTQLLPRNILGMFAF